MATSTSNVTQKASLVEKLTSTNYSIWNVQMEMLLKLIQAFTFVDGSEPNPGTAIPATQLAHGKSKMGMHVLTSFYIVMINKYNW
jgi:hypothetical protein